MTARSSTVPQPSLAPPANPSIRRSRHIPSTNSRLPKITPSQKYRTRHRTYAPNGSFPFSRKNGAEYDQSHLPVVQQYEAVGHAVRAVYSYTGMADIAMATGDPDYHSAGRSRDTPSIIDVAMFRRMVYGIPRICFEYENR